MGSQSLRGLARSARETRAWSAASDWDAAASETGVWHINSTDASAGSVRLGYGDWVISGFPASLFFQHDEAAGAATITDYAGSNDGSTVNSPGNVSDGPHGNTAISYDDANNEYTATNYTLPTNGDFAVVVAFRTTKSTQNPFLCNWSDSAEGLVTGVGGYDANVPSGALDMAIRDTENGDNDHIYTDSTGWDDGAWHLAIFERDYAPSNGADQMQIWVDGSQRTYTVERSQTCDSLSTYEYQVARNGWGTYYADIDAGPLFTVERLLTSSEKTALWDAWTAGQLTTATRSFSAPRKPELQNLNYSLNGESITLEVIGSPGTSDEEVNSVSLTGQASEDLSWAAGHRDFRIRPKISTAAVTSSPVFNSGELIS